MNERSAALLPTERPLGTAMLNGARGRCPHCGEGKIFYAYLKVVDACPACGEPLHHHRADDAPAYIVISIVAHIVVGLLLTVEMNFAPPVWLHLILWVPMTIIMSLALLPVVKGALVGMQWALRMHGFGSANPDGPPAAR
ncbi:DUF983 domain-containing protein [Terrihabitans sp. B22-R8]|uniref:DUF983 domain-containing protein n=1 Tax=Terrihabitans sp. B22-R8 TaxID=3425128 RepID=UPI00403CB1B4